MKVLKFGGTSVGSADRIRHVGRLVCESGRNVVVLSAMSGTTNSLVEISGYLAKGNIPGAQNTLNGLRRKYADVIDELFETPHTKARITAHLERIFNLIATFAKEGEFTEDDEKEILAQGELISTSLMKAHLDEQGVRCAMIPALEYMRINEDGEPDMKYIASHLRRQMELEPEADLWLTQGYICRNARGNIDNLRRGGSDYSAAIVGAVLGVDEIQIWTDIDGMHTGDPRFVSDTLPVKQLHYEEAAELAYFGAKILHPTCILPAKVNNIPVRLLNTLEPEAHGTLIYNNLAQPSIKAVAAKDNVIAIKIKSSRMLLAYGFLTRVFATFEKYKTPIDMIATSEVGVSLSIDSERYLPEIIDELKQWGTVTVDKDMVIIAVVGNMEWTNTGYEARTIEALSEIPVRMISYGGSNFNISFLIRKEDKVKALNLLSSKLFNNNAAQ